jgi:peptidoglycan-N-acetylglucosamine deacetylase
MSYPWPNDKRCAVVLSFDVDAESGLYFINPEKAARSLSALEERRYGPRVGVPRILRLLDRYRLRATFYLPGFTIENHYEACRSIRDAGHEIGAHGVVHENVEQLDLEREEAILRESLAIMDERLGVRPVGWRAPFLGINKTTPALLRRHGFVYDSSLSGYDVPYLIETPDGPLVEIPALSLLDDVPYYRHVPGASDDIADPEKVLRIYTREFRALYEEHGCFTLIQHPYLAGRPSHIAALEELIRYLRGFPGVWFATCREVAEWVTGPARTETVSIPRSVTDLCPDRPDRAPRIDRD